MIADNVIENNCTHTPEASLPPELRAVAAFGGIVLADADALRIHDNLIRSDVRAAELAAAINTRAFTVGRDVFFARGALASHQPRGRWLLAHELAHVAQEGHSPGTTIRRAPPDGAGPGETAPFAAGDIITAAEFEATFQGSRRLASGTIALQLSPAGDHFVVPESAVEKTPRHLAQQHLAVSFKQNLEGQLWESRLESAKDRQKTALAARRIGASDSKPPSPPILKTRTLGG